MGDDRRSFKTRENLRQALLEILREKPFDKVRITEISKRAGISRKAFYVYYANVYELAFDCYDTFLEMDSVDISPSSFKTVEETVRWLIGHEKNRLLFSRENPRLMEIIFESVYMAPHTLQMLERSQDIIYRFFRGSDRRNEYPDEHWSIRVRQNNEEQAPFHFFSRDICARLVFLCNAAVIQEWIKDGFREPIDLVAIRVAYVNSYVIDFSRSTNSVWLNALSDYAAEFETVD